MKSHYHLKSLITIGFIIYSITSSTAQSKIYNKGNYYINQKVYSYQQLDSLFSMNSIAYLQFLEYNNRLDDMDDYLVKGCVFSVVGVLSITGSIAWKAEGLLDALIIFPLKIGLGAVGIGFTFAGVINLVKHSSSKSKADMHLQKAVDFLNDNPYDHHKNKIESSIDFGLTKSGGLGITYSF